MFARMTCNAPVPFVEEQPYIMMPPVPFNMGMVLLGSYPQTFFLQTLQDDLLLKNFISLSSNQGALFCAFFFSSSLRGIQGWR